MKSLVVIWSVLLAMFVSACAEVHAQEASPARAISAPAPSLPPNADPATVIAAIDNAI